MNALPADVETIALETIAKNEGRSVRTVRANLERAGVRIVYAGSRRASVLTADYRRHLTGSSL